MNKVWLENKKRHSLSPRALLCF